MNFRFICVWALALNSLAMLAAAQQPKVDETKEPPITYQVTLGESKFEVKEGESITANGTFSNPSVSVEAQPYRVFPYRGVTFQYPRGFMFEADLDDPDYNCWTLSGNNLKLLYFHLGERVTAASIAGNMMDQFGRENCKVISENATRVFGKHTLSGLTFRAKLASAELAIEVYAVPSPKGTTRLLMIQDSLDDEGKSSKEALESCKVLEASFEVSPE